MQNMGGGKTALGLDTNIGVLICYFGGILCGVGGIIYSIMVITQDKTNRVVRFHAFQALFLFALGFVIGIPLGIIYVIAMFVDMALGLPIFMGLGFLLSGVVMLGFLYFVVMAAIKGYNGEVYKIPVVGNFAEKYV